MTRRKSLQTRVTAARTVRDIMSLYEGLDCNQPRLRALCTLLYCIASDEPKASYKHKMLEVMKYDQNKHYAEKSDHSVVVDGMSDLMVMALGVLINKIPDEESRDELRPGESPTLVGIRVRNELLEIERMILSEEELNSRELEEKKRESKMLQDKERMSKAKDRLEQKKDNTKLKMEKMKIEEDNWELAEMETRALNGMNHTERILDLCESLPSTSRVKEEPIDEDEIIEVEPSNFMTRTRARMERVRRLGNGDKEGRGVIVGGTAEIRGVRRVHTNQFEPSNSQHYVVTRNVNAYIPPMNPIARQMRRPGPSLLSSRLERLEKKTPSPSPPPSSPPTLTLRSILQAQIPTHTLVTKSVRKRMRPDQ